MKFDKEIFISSWVVIIGAALAASAMIIIVMTVVGGYVLFATWALSVFGINIR